MGVLAAAASGGGGNAGAVILLILSVVAYFLPSIIGAIRRVPSLGAVIVVNLFLGWTVIGWIVALAMALRSRPQPLPRRPVSRSAGG